MLAAAAPVAKGTTLNLAVIVPIICAVVAAVAAVVVARRQFGGRIEHSEASSLWEESRAIRQELYRENLECRSEVQNLRSEVLTLRKLMMDAGIEVPDASD